MSCLLSVRSCDWPQNCLFPHLAFCFLDFCWEALCKKVHIRPRKKRLSLLTCKTPCGFISWGVGSWGGLPLRCYHASFERTRAKDREDLFLIKIVLQAVEGRIRGKTNCNIDLEQKTAAPASRVWQESCKSTFYGNGGEKGGLSERRRHHSALFERPVLFIVTDGLWKMSAIHFGERRPDSWANAGAVTWPWVRATALAEL